VQKKKNIFIIILNNFINNYVIDTSNWTVLWSVNFEIEGSNSILDIDVFVCVETSREIDYPQNLSCLFNTEILCTNQRYEEEGYSSYHRAF
jgi:hypothetical protein